MLNSPDNLNHVLRQFGLACCNSEYCCEKLKLQKSKFPLLTSPKQLQSLICGLSLAPYKQCICGAVVQITSLEPHQRTWKHIGFELVSERLGPDLGRVVQKFLYRKPFYRRSGGLFDDFL